LNGQQALREKSDAASRPDIVLNPAEVDAQPRIRLAGNTRPEAKEAVDLGPVDDGLPMEHMLLQLQRTPAQQAALDGYLAAVADRSSPSYHKWLSPQEFGERFGVSQANLEVISGWLALHELTVNADYPSRMVIDFSATAGQIREAFGTEVHAYEVTHEGRTERHIANDRDPMIPAALAPFIAGIVSMHDFRPRTLLSARPQLTAASGASISYPVTPADLATIYNLTPLFKAGYTGKGETIAVIEDSDVYSATDWTTFRTAFGLTAYATGTFKQVHPEPVKGAANCTDPGAIPGWDEEPILDAEYASASAPGAAIEVASCADTKATSGVLIALENVVNAATRPSVLSISYGNCEAANGAAANAAIGQAYSQAAAEGISVFAAAGDGGASFCDVGSTVAQHGIGVNAYASTPYNVAVGGTDFSDTYSGTTATYWNKTNSSTDGSAKSYVPEIPWNDSCASPQIAGWYGYSGFAGIAAFCLEDFLTMAAYQTTLAGSGGPSGCATGTPRLAYVTGGTCKGWAKPTWQSVTGNPKDTVRDLPDVALFAADGIWNHSYLFCDSNTADSDGAVCKNQSVADWSQGGGTSFAAPVMAGIQALINQKWGAQGNPNPVYYKLATTEYASSTTRAGCNAANGVNSTSTCIFHDVTTGASTVNCEGLVACYSYILSTAVSPDDPAYNAVAGWDFASGLGSVNAYNLVMSTAW
jgi:subtilase family serine protease